MSRDVTRRRTSQGIASVPYLFAIGGRTAFAATNATGVYVGVVDLPGGRIALSINGQDTVAYICNGTDSDAQGSRLNGESARGAAPRTPPGELCSPGPLAKGDSPWNPVMARMREVADRDSARSV
jgi:hypothetical protein